MKPKSKFKVGDICIGKRLKGKSSITFSQEKIVSISDDKYTYIRLDDPKKELISILNVIFEGCMELDPTFIILDKFNKDLKELLK